MIHADVAFPLHLYILRREGIYYSQIYFLLLFPTKSEIQIVDMPPQAKRFQRYQATKWKWTTPSKSYRERTGRRLIEKAAASPPAYLLVLVARSEVKSVVRRKNRSRPYQVIRELLTYIQRSKQTLRTSLTQLQESLNYCVKPQPLYK